MDKSQKYAKWKKANIKDHKWFQLNEILEKTKLQWQKADHWLPEAEGEGRECKGVWRNFLGRGVLNFDTSTKFHHTVRVKLIIFLYINNTLTNKKEGRKLQIFKP